LSFITGNESDEDEWVLCRYVVCGIDDVSRNDNRVIMGENGIVLYKEEIKEIPLKEVHYQKTEGRWLGIGVVEATFEAQRRANEIKNQEAHAMEVGSKIIFQSRDDSVASNVTTDLDNGDILTVKSEITPIATELRDLRSFLEASKSVDELADRLTFSFDVVRGEASPSGTTLGAVQIQQQQASSVFDYKRENIGLFLNDYIQDIVFPQIEKDLNKEHLLRYAGTVDEIQSLRKNFATHLANKAVIERILNGDIITEFEQQEIIDKELAKLSGSDHLWVDIKKNFFKDLDYHVDLVTTGENKNLYAQIINNKGLLDTFAANPMILQDPATRMMVFKIMTALGMRVSELEKIESAVVKQQADQQQQQKQLQGQQLLQGAQSQQKQQGGQPAQSIGVNLQQ